MTSGELDARIIAGMRGLGPLRDAARAVACSSPLNPDDTALRAYGDALEALGRLRDERDALAREAGR